MEHQRIHDHDMFCIVEDADHRLDEDLGKLEGIHGARPAASLFAVDDEVVVLRRSEL